MDSLTYIRDCLWADLAQPTGTETIEFCRIQTPVKWESCFEKTLREVYAKIRATALLHLLRVAAIDIMWNIACLFLESERPHRLATLFAKCEDIAEPQKLITKQKAGNAKTTETVSRKRRKRQMPPPTIDCDWKLFGELSGYPAPIVINGMSSVIDWRGNVNTAARMAISTLEGKDQSLVEILARKYIVSDADIRYDRPILQLPPWDRPATHWSYGKSRG